METWRLLRTYSRPGGWNMGLDEALLRLPHRRPTLRLYTWEPETLSLGYFQRAADVPALEEAECAVRRLTGGGAIHHAHELTFSISVGADHPLYAGEVRASYQRIHGTIAAALARLGVAARPRGRGALISDRDSGGMCFENSSELDLAWDGRKGVGSAQRRTGGRILHHGSIKLAPSRLDREVAGVHDRAPTLSAEQLGEHLLDAFAAQHGLRFQAEEPTPAEIAHADQRAAFFTSEAFLHRR